MEQNTAVVVEPKKNNGWKRVGFASQFTGVDGAIELFDWAPLFKNIDFTKLDETELYFVHYGVAKALADHFSAKIKSSTPAEYRKMLRDYYDKRVARTYVDRERGETKEELRSKAAKAEREATYAAMRAAMAKTGMSPEAIEKLIAEMNSGRGLTV